MSFVSKAGAKVLFFFHSTKKYFHINTLQPVFQQNKFYAINHSEDKKAVHANRKTVFLPFSSLR
jgi:hypothetical protein